MTQPLEMLKRQVRRLWDLPARILNRLTPRVPEGRRQAADRSVTDSRARFWQGVREGRREAAERVTRGAP